MVKDRFDGPPIGLRVTKTDAEILKRLAATMYDGMTVSVSDVARLLLHAGMAAYGIRSVHNGSRKHPDDPIVRFSLDTGNTCNGK